MDHHPSCRESDRKLVIVCAQCGKLEEAPLVEEVIQAARGLREASYATGPAARDRLELALAALERSGLVPRATA